MVMSCKGASDVILFVCRSALLSSGMMSWMVLLAKQNQRSLQKKKQLRPETWKMAKFTSTVWSIQVQEQVRYVCLIVPSQTSS